MEIYQYSSYDEYVAAQTEANIQKLGNVWVSRQTIRTIKHYQSVARTILCHGTRNAAEQKYFRQYYPRSEVVGTEISHTAEQFPMTIQWDFHDVNPRWINKFDIVYSNAIDHSYDPVKMLTTWRDQVSTNGKLYIEHGYANLDNHSRLSDPLAIHDEEIRYLITKVGMDLVNVFETTGLKGRCPSRVYIIRKQP